MHSQRLGVYQEAMATTQGQDNKTPAKAAIVGMKNRDRDQCKRYSRLEVIETGMKELQ
jgi:hypothetical protein